MSSIATQALVAVVIRRLARSGLNTFDQSSAYAAIALAPRGILYDEPTTGLDPITGNTINHLIRSLQKRLGITSVVVTHDIHSAFTVGDRVAFLYEGKILFEGTVEEAKQSDEPRLRNFVTGGGYG